MGKKEGGMRHIVYLTSGAAHLPYLVCSLYTLRQHWQGPVHVFSWSESRDIARQIALDNRLQIEFHDRQPAYRGKCDQFMDKQKVVEEWPDHRDVLLYLDADTTVHGDVSPLLAAAEDAGFAATQWNDWMSGRGIARKRILDLLGVSDIPEGLIREIISEDWPSVNGGVWAAKPDSGVLPVWYDWTMKARHLFIADEKVLHVLQKEFASTGEMTTVLGGRYNCSPIYQPPDMPDGAVVVRHYHGDACVRPSKGARNRGPELWWPVWRECLEQNIGGVRQWWREAGNKYLDKMMEEGRASVSP